MTVLIRLHHAYSYWFRRSYHLSSVKARLLENSTIAGHVGLYVFKLYFTVHSQIKRIMFFEKYVGTDFRNTDSGLFSFCIRLFAWRITRLTYKLSPLPGTILLVGIQRIIYKKLPTCRRKSKKRHEEMTMIGGGRMRRVSLDEMLEQNRENRFKQVE